MTFFCLYKARKCIEVAVFGTSLIKRTGFVILLSCIVRISAMAQQPGRFMVVSDAHHYSPSPDFTQNLLYEITLAAIHEKVDFVFFTGDLGLRGFATPAEEDLVLKDWRFVLDTLRDNNIKVYACRGNTDLNGGAAWDSLFTGINALPLNGPGNEKGLSYFFETENIFFIALDEFTENYKINQAWLDALPAAGKMKFIFVAGHTPAFKVFNSKCLGTYPAERDIFWESLTQSGAKAYFSGHDHFYDHAIIDDGDGNPGNDIHQFIVATGGSSFFPVSEYDGNNGRWMPEGIFHEAATGYILAEVYASEARITWKHRVEKNVFEYGGDSIVFTSPLNESVISVPDNFVLRQFPNPFRSKTIISYRLPSDDAIELNIYNPDGQKVCTLVKEQQTVGKHEIKWEAGELMPGMYFSELKTGQIRQIRKMILLK
jgi:predicted phosphodiesterase